MSERASVLSVRLPKAVRTRLIRVGHGGPDEVAMMPVTFVLMALTFFVRRAVAQQQGCVFWTATQRGDREGSVTLQRRLDPISLEVVAQQAGVQTQVAHDPTDDYSKVRVDVPIALRRDLQRVSGRLAREASIPGDRALTAAIRVALADLEFAMWELGAGRIIVAVPDGLAEGEGVALAKQLWPLPETDSGDSTSG